MMMMMMIMRAQLLLAALLGLAGTTVAQTVKTLNGTIQGGQCNSTAVNYFFSIPFAKPPVGDLRFAPPQPYDSAFSGTLNATTPAVSCIQFSSAFAETNEQSEDCLYLDVYAPAGATSSSGLPVKVWIYGGSNDAGGISDATYNGCFSALDSIVVSINYRLGPLGFLALTSLGLSGNQGIMDQLLALQWVQENIAAFGGDPKKVLVFGQSAGGQDIFFLATRSEAPSLMNAAAMESGAGRDYSTIDKVQPFQNYFLEGLNCTDITCARAASSVAIYAAAQAMPVPKVVTADSLLDNFGAGNTWGPLIDGTLVTEQPVKTGLKVPSIVGYNTEDASLFVFGQYGKSALTLNESAYDAFLEYNFGDAASVVNKTYSVARFNSTAAPVFAAMVSVFTAYGFACPAYRAQLSGIANGVPVYAYSFNHTNSCSWYDYIPAAIIPYLGPTHTAEIPYVFNMTTMMPPPNGNCTFTAAEQVLARSLSAAWTSMAADAKPGSDSFWPAFAGANQTSGIVINDEIVAGTIDYSVCTAFWDAVAVSVEKQEVGTNYTASVTSTISPANTATVTKSYGPTAATAATSSAGAVSSSSSKAGAAPACPTGKIGEIVAYGGLLAAAFEALVR